MRRSRILRLMPLRSLEHIQVQRWSFKRKHRRILGGAGRCMRARDGCRIEVGMLQVKQ